MIATFNRALARARVIYLGGLLCAAALRLLAFMLAAFLGCGLFDAIFAFGERTRLTMALALLLVTVSLAGYWLLTILSTPRRAIARWVDSVLPTRRRPVLSALELADAPVQVEASSFGKFLLEGALDQGRRAVAGRTWRQLLPQRLLKRDALRLGAVTALSCAVCLIWNAPARTHSLRLLAPRLDTPPWSRIGFAVTPTDPDVIYGESLEICATITGPTGGRAAVFEIRAAGRTHRSAGFREGTDRFVHRLERVVQPLQFCVRSGRARSHWYNLTVRFQPRIASARVTVSPPAYTGLPQREFYLGGKPLTALRGARVTLDISANRPIHRGRVTFTDPDGSERRLDGETQADQSIRYEWQVDSDATASIHIFDALGTANARTHTFRQKRLLDEPPAVAILSPPRYSLATPDSLIKVEASAEDALGLRSASLVRNLVGYRDRALPVGLAIGAREARVDYPIDLRLLGATPGNTIELYAEAADTNPDMLGTSMSDVSRIDVISHDQYAEILRMRTAVAELGERYRLIASQLDQLRDALRELAASAEAPHDSPLSRRKAIDRALAAWDRLDETYARMAADFAIYDMEQQLPETLDAIRSLSDPYAGRLKNLPDPIPESPQIASQWLRAIGDAAEELERQTEDAAQVDLLMQVARSAMQLQLMIDRQAALLRKLSRYEANLRTTPSALLGEIARDQARVASMLDAWQRTTAALADSLPEEQAELADKMRALLQSIREAKAHVYMVRAVTAANNEDAPDAFRNIREALEALRSAVNQCEKSGNEYAGMCRNPGQGFTLKPGLCDTMSQLCQALIRQFGKKNGSSGGPGMGGGGVAGGDPANGYWTAGSSVLDVPLHGPSRSRLGSPSGRGRGQGGTGTSRAAGTVRATEYIDVQSTEATKTQAVTLDEIPERYREPARVFYSIDDTPEGPHSND
jgi:hypothetical protein